ncbi:hypothetical protein C465_08026 [Halorubrum distributum JCM 9100]|uniref:DUF8113 domain-containing protein n=4 Tax=Halorubrum distributum TaxID=29283 RepID=M0ERK4_9EURY|nr:MULTISPECIES: hypothetical protein [Halorubrum distributum group]ELZ32261.1 hypothetical protein C473_09612 [Halorubrum terrestre JCM 10247]ELZ49502.1 hypothetical protein C465_08026 [Halorubrum distributum JCM 9100]ELZ57495.1 hypothetical protein C466_01694 [Halorubrum distributum JCM 10118]EMA59566.1 hypothetical protein C470_10942 [Halorubrum litoreum JCM 13561]MDV7350883.1 hypothetical protein [Halorubrum distributum]
MSDDDPADADAPAGADRSETADDSTGTVDSADAAESASAADDFETELARARDLLDGDDIDAVHVGVVRDGEVDTTFAQRTDGDAEGAGLRALALLAAHVRLVAGEAGVEPSTVAGDAATLAGQVEQIPASTDQIPDE